jgi:hypothetical protein
MRERIEVRFIDRFQQHRHRSLHDLVFQDQDGQREIANLAKVRQQLVSDSLRKLLYK